MTEAETSAVDNPYRYSTKEWDERSGLYYFGARYYSPEIGRWTQRDPAGTVDGLNVYAYMGNEAAGRVDPWGLQDPSGMSGVASYRPPESGIGLTEIYKAECFLRAIGSEFWMVKDYYYAWDTAFPSFWLHGNRPGMVFLSPLLSKHAIYINRTHPDNANWSGLAWTILHEHMHLRGVSKWRLDDPKYDFAKRILNLRIEKAKEKGNYFCCDEFTHKKYWLNRFGWAVYFCDLGDCRTAHNYSTGRLQFRLP